MEVSIFLRVFNSDIGEAIFTLTGRVTMLSISRLTNDGGSYRSVQRFFAARLPWLNIFWLVFEQHLYQSEEVYLLAGDESIVTKSGNQTHGVDRKETLKLLLEKPAPILMEQVIEQVGSLGRIHSEKAPATTS